MEAAQPKSVKHVPSYCYNCVSGPDLMNVKVVDGIATEIEPNFAAAEVHPAKGKVCVKAYGLVQKTYNPNRVSTPMKRTNPKKGRNEDPGFVPISWDEALDLVADKLKAVRAKGLVDEAGSAARRRQPRPWRHAVELHGHLPGLPRRLGRRRFQLRFRPGRQVRAFRAPLWRVLASRLHRRRRHAELPLQHRGRRQRRRHRWALRGDPPRRRPRARLQAGAGRAAPVGHRRLLGRMGADPAQDRPGLPVRADPCAGARERTRQARHSLPA